MENLGQSTYNALQVKAERRFRNGLNLLASYTYSKTITDADSSFPVFTGFNSNVFGAQNPYNLRNEKSLSYQDIPHTFVMSYLYELPLGKGKKLLNKGGIVDKIVGGWQVGGVHRYQVGSPFVIYAAGTSPPNITGGNYHLSVIPGQPWLMVFAWLCLTGFFMFFWISPFWVLPTLSLTSSAAAVSIGVINMCANLAGALSQASSQVRAAREAVASGERSLTSLRAAADQAQQVVTIVNVSFQAGGATNIEVIDAERSARDADTAVAAAEDTLRRARLDLLLALGRFP